MKKNLGMLLSITVVTSMMFSSVPVFAAQLPDKTINSKFTIDVSADEDVGPAIPDKISTMARSSYRVLGSDVWLNIDDSNGHGGDYVAEGWVRATAPKFYARAEVWANGRQNVTGRETYNVGDKATASSYPTVGLINNATPRIFYGWD